MNKSLVGFVAGVVVGVGGTLLVDYILKRREEKELETDEEEYVVGEYTKMEVNPTDVRRVVDEKPDIETVVDYRRYADMSKKYNPNADPDIQKVIDAAIEEAAEPDIDDPDGGEEYAAYMESVEEEVIAESQNIFDTAEPVTETFTREDAIPPQFRNIKINGPHDIVEISQEQYHIEAMDYVKQSCTYFVNDGILAESNDELNQMDIPTTVGQAILNRFEEVPVMTLFVSNISTEIDYEIVLEEMSYEEALADLKQRDHGDEECQDETS